MTTYHLRGTDGTEVFTGTIQPPVGGSLPDVPITFTAVTDFDSSAVFATNKNAPGLLRVGPFLKNPAIGSYLLILTRHTGDGWSCPPGITAGPSLSQEIPLLAGPFDVPIFGLRDETMVVLLANGGQGTPSAFTTAFADPDANLLWTSALDGTFGDQLSIEYVDPGAPNSPLSWRWRAPFALQILLATDGAGAIVTTANDIAQLWSDFNEFNALFTAPGISGGDGTGVVEALSEQPLTGGDPHDTGAGVSVNATFERS